VCFAVSVTWCASQSGALCQPVVVVVVGGGGRLQGATIAVVRFVNAALLCEMHLLTDVRTYYKSELSRSMFDLRTEFYGRYVWIVNGEKINIEIPFMAHCQHQNSTIYPTY